VLALIVYQLGNFFAGNGFNAGTVAGIVALGLLVWLLARRPAGSKVIQRHEALNSAA
jgi:membrane-bound lytic murein transglycosylase